MTGAKDQLIHLHGARDQPIHLHVLELFSESLRGNGPGNSALL